MTEHGTHTAQRALEAIRDAAARYDAPVGSGVIGTVGRDVPAELVEAFGLHPLRLRGDPSWPTSEADEYLGRGLDEATRSVLAGILAGAYGELDGIVVSSDCDASQRLFYVLREMHRIDPTCTLPPVHLVDVLHLPREATARYNLRKLEQLSETLHEWSGRTAGAEELAAAIHNRNAVRELQGRVMALRRTQARLSGTDALAVLRAADRMPQSEYLERLTALVQHPEELPVQPGERLFLTGSNHDTPEVYQTIERCGYVIVGEDHDWGEMTSYGSVEIGEAEAVAGDDTLGGDERRGLLRAVARRLLEAPPTSQRASVRQRADYCAGGVESAEAAMLLSYVRVLDEAPLWDFAAQRRAVKVKSAVITNQRYGCIDQQQLDRALHSPETTGVNA